MYYRMENLDGLSQHYIPFMIRYSRIHDRHFHPARINTTRQTQRRQSCLLMKNVPFIPLKENYMKLSNIYFDLKYFDAFS